eukprot:TRINITY_DN8012_c0_g1_i1.p1 TRINITY_DN8012_c0_g1~~TRINITY_DN8012_c0_g1_i1.p1  ORF type:complete len:144 (-),score=11.58 TRINITY_DN8012_c0_g1_i1:63-494(-)
MLVLFYLLILPVSAFDASQCAAKINECITDSAQFQSCLKIESTRRSEEIQDCLRLHGHSSTGYSSCGQVTMADYHCPCLSSTALPCIGNPTCNSAILSAMPRDIISCNLTSASAGISRGESKTVLSLQFIILASAILVLSFEF